MAGCRRSDLSFLAFCSPTSGVIAAIVQILEMLLDKYVPALQRPGVFLPLITVNCAIMAGSLFMVERDYNLMCLWHGGSGCPWAMAIALLAGIARS